MNTPEIPSSDLLSTKIEHDLRSFSNYLRAKSLGTLGSAGAVIAAYTLHSDVLNISAMMGAMPVAMGLYVWRNRAIRNMKVLKPRNLFERLSDGLNTSSPLRGLAEDISTAVAITTPIFAVWATEATVHAIMEPSFAITASAVSALCLSAAGVEVDKTAHADMKAQAALFVEPDSPKQAA